MTVAFNYKGCFVLEGNKQVRCKTYLDLFQALEGEGIAYDEILKGFDEFHSESFEKDVNFIEFGYGGTFLFVGYDGDLETEEFEDEG